jgi:hypothetical protein
MPWFAEVAKGYCFEQAAERCLYVWEWIENTFYGDDEVYTHALDLAIAANALIRMGKIPVPDRHDGLYDCFRDANQVLIAANLEANT